MPRGGRSENRRSSFASLSLNSEGKSLVSVGGSSSVSGIITTGKVVSRDIVLPPSHTPSFTAARMLYVILGWANVFPVYLSINTSPSSSDGGTCKHCSGRPGSGLGTNLVMTKWKGALRTSCPGVRSSCITSDNRISCAWLRNLRANRLVHLDQYLETEVGAVGIATLMTYFALACQNPRGRSWPFCYPGPRNSCNWF